MSIWEILIPTMMPNGRTILTQRHHAWDEKVRQIASGLTILTPVKGQWISPDNELVFEQMIPVRIACTAYQIKEIAMMTIKFYEQQEVMYYRISNEVHTLERRA